MFRQLYLEAIEVVLAWDLPDEALTDAINHQVMHHNDTDDEYGWQNYPSTSLAFNH